MAQKKTVAFSDDARYCAIVMDTEYIKIEFKDVCFEYIFDLYT